MGEVKTFFTVRRVKEDEANEMYRAGKAGHLGNIVLLYPDREHMIYTYDDCNQFLFKNHKSYWEEVGSFENRFIRQNELMKAIEHMIISPEQVVNQEVDKKELIKFIKENKGQFLGYMNSKWFKGYKEYPMKKKVFVQMYLRLEKEIK